MALAFCAALPAWADAGPYGKQPYIDPDFRDVDLKMRAEEAKCPGNPVKAMFCREQVRKKWAAMGDVRGTPEYVRKHWGSLSRQELRQKISEETVIYHKTRPLDVTGPPPEPGEVTDSMIDAEIGALQNLKGEKGGGYHPY